MEISTNSPGENVERLPNIGVLIPTDGEKEIRHR